MAESKKSRFAQTSDTPQKKAEFSPLWIKITSDVEFSNIRNNISLYRVFSEIIEQALKTNKISLRETEEYSRKILKKINYSFPGVRLKNYRTLGEKMYQDLWNRVFSIYTSPKGAYVKYKDDLNEMDVLKNKIFTALNGYARAAKLASGRHMLRNLDLKKYYSFDITKSEVIFYKNTGWLLEGPHHLFASGEIEVKKMGSEIWLIARVDLRMRWIDRIDAGGSLKQDNFGKYAFERFWEFVVEPITNCDFTIEIEWNLVKWKKERI